MLTTLYYAVVINGCVVCVILVCMYIHTLHIIPRHINKCRSVYSCVWLCICIMCVMHYFPVSGRCYIVGSSIVVDYYLLTLTPYIRVAA